jgi:hypothetical protein
VTLNKTATTIAAGSSETLTATVQPSNATNKAVTWSSDNTAVASVNGSGQVTAHAAGTATITVTTEDGNHKANCTVTVESAANPVTGVALNKNATALIVGGSETLLATIQPSNATNKAVTWSSSDSAIASVNGSGLVTALSEGTATITVTTDDGNHKANCTVTVSAPISVTVSPKTATTTIGGTVFFTAEVTGGLGNQNVAWTATGGTITPEGVYTAPAALGTYIVTATSVENTAKYDTAEVTVITAGVAIIDPPMALFSGETHTFSADVIGLDDKSVTWSASAGTINQATGAFTAPTSAQMATITATSVEMPALVASVQVKISSAAFDGNSKTNPQLLDLANAYGSTDPEDLAKYDLNDDGAIDDEDLKILFRAMGW